MGGWQFLRRHSGWHSSKDWGGGASGRGVRRTIVGGLPQLSSAGTQALLQLGGGRRAPETRNGGGGTAALQRLADGL